LKHDVSRAVDGRSCRSSTKGTWNVRKRLALQHHGNQLPTYDLEDALSGQIRRRIGERSFERNSSRCIDDSRANLGCKSEVGRSRYRIAGQHQRPDVRLDMNATHEDG